jgi:prepilin-type N-terminal cleavage/methylation domain-containing protein
VVSKGFTLIEVITTVLILGIIATLALPSLQSVLGDSKLSGAGSEVAVALEYAQVAAMTNGEETRVTIDDTADTILVEGFKINGDILNGASQFAESDIDSGAFVAMAHPTKRGEDYFIEFADEDRFSHVDISSATFGIGNNVTFDALGFPSDGGTVTLVYGDKQLTVTVDSLTGKVTSSD